MELFLGFRKGEVFAYGGLPHNLENLEDGAAPELGDANDDRHRT